MRNALVVLFVLMLFGFNAFANEPRSTFVQKSEISSPQSPVCTEMISNAETATTDPFDPWNAGNGSVGMDGKTGIFLVSKFTAIGRAVEPVIACFGKHGSNYYLLSDANGSTSITVSPTDDSTIENNTNDDTSYWSTPSAKIDALGAESVTCNVVTAASAGDGTVVIEACAY